MVLDGQVRLEDVNEEYAAFVEKFKPKKTTDDCYTPENVYNAVRDWACREYGIEPDKIVRPFWPGGDYERFDYPDGCVVLDNPPFSILSSICAFYDYHGIGYFLFAPSLTCIGASSSACKIIPDAEIVYANGAKVLTAFVSSLDRRYVVRSAPDLRRTILAANEENVKADKAELPKYTYPDHVLTAAMVQRYSKYGVEYAVEREDAAFIRVLDAQRSSGKAIFGGGLLLSEGAAAERAAAERAAATRWELSERELAAVALLGKQ